MYKSAGKEKVVILSRYKIESIKKAIKFSTDHDRIGPSNI